MGGKMKGYKKAQKIYMCCIIVGLFLSSIFFGEISYSAQSVGYETDTGDVRGVIIGNSYKSYLKQYQDKQNPLKSIKIEANSFKISDKPLETFNNYEGEDGDSVLLDEGSYIEWEINVAQEGLYSLEIYYFPVKGSGSSIETMVLINGSIPFNEARHINVSRIWKDDLEENEDFLRDSRDNEIRPQQIESPEWRLQAFEDILGYYENPFSFYFKEGINTIRLSPQRGSLFIRWLKLFNSEPTLEYKDILLMYKEKGFESASEKIRIQAQNTFRKSDPVIYPVNDRTSPATYPQDISKIRLNSIGRERWQQPGQWITWKVDVPESGLYKIVLRFRQNLFEGMFTSRKLLINGDLPFREAGNLRFNYGDRWQVANLGNTENDFLFYFDEGKNELTLKVVLGDMGNLLMTVEDSLFMLNEIYRNILMITGPVPDIYRDYNFTNLIPEVINEMEKQAKVIRDVSAKLADITGSKGQHVILLDKIAYELEEMNRNPETIASRFDGYKGSIGALGTWILITRQQPLELDFIELMPENESLPPADKNWFSRIIFHLRAFIASFSEDYRTVGNIYDLEDNLEEVVEVWIPTGRDQAQIIRQMADDTFTPVSNIGVDLRLVAPGSLLPAVLANTGPDIALSLTPGEPVNFAIRKAVVDLTEFDDYADILKRFHPSSVIPFVFKDSLYALPETFSFPMLFYRKDIMAELGLEVPETWEEFYSIIPIINRNNMEVGFPSGFLGHLIFLEQLESTLYRDNGARTNLDSEENLLAFKMMSEMFTLYRLPAVYDFPNRFRTGEMPIGIVDYTTYNILTVFAPEIRGLWEFTKVPGIKRDDGTINYSSVGGGAASSMLRNVKNKDNAWRFLKWWTQSETQSRFGIEMEAVIGSGAKYPSANTEAMNNLPWTISEYNSIMSQWDEVAGVPQVPGGYYVDRSMAFAFNRVYNYGINPADALDYYINDINSELSRKRREFGID